MTTQNAPAGILFQALRAVDQHGTTIDDPIERARMLSEAIEFANGELLGGLAVIRATALHQAREKMSAQEVAERLGISRARVYAIIDGR